MAETNEQRAERFYKTRQLPFYLSYFPGSARGSDPGSPEFQVSYFTATTEQANNLGLILDKLVGKNHPDIEFVGEGDFMGWSIKDIAENIDGFENAQIGLEEVE
jgi:hypothetical protein